MIDDWYSLERFLNEIVADTIPLDQPSKRVSFQRLLAELERKAESPFFSFDYADRVRLRMTGIFDEYLEEMMWEEELKTLCLLDLLAAILDEKSDEGKDVDAELIHSIWILQSYLYDLIVGFYSHGEEEIEEEIEEEEGEVGTEVGWKTKFKLLRKAGKLIKKRTPLNVPQMGVFRDGYMTYGAWWREIDIPTMRWQDKKPVFLSILLIPSWDIAKEARKTKANAWRRLKEGTIAFVYEPCADFAYIAIDGERWHSIKPTYSASDIFKTEGIPLSEAEINEFLEAAIEKALEIEINFLGYRSVSELFADPEGKLVRLSEFARGDAKLRKRLYYLARNHGEKHGIRQISKRWYVQDGKEWRQILYFLQHPWRFMLRRWARYFSIPYGMLAKAAHEGRIKAVKIGSTWYADPMSVWTFLDRQGFVPTLEKIIMDVLKFFEENA